MSDHRPPGAEQLRRSLGMGGVLVLTLAALSPAASVFVTGAAILHLAGTGAVIAVVGGGIVAMIGTMLYAELGAAFPHAGGVYHGIGEVLGASAGTVAMVLGLVTAPALVAFVALGLAAYVRALGVDLSPLVIADGAIGLAIGVSALRLRAGLWLTGLVLAVELAMLIALTVIGWWHPARSIVTALRHPVIAATGGGGVSPGVVPLMLATLAAAYACSGASLALNFAEEVAGNQRRIGRVVVWSGVLAVMMVALPLISVAVGNPDLATFSAEAPIAVAVRVLAGARVATALAAVVALAILDHATGAVIAYSRFIFAAARSLGHKAKPLASIDDRTGAPAAAAAALGVLAVALTLIGERGLLLLVSGELISPTLMIVAVLVGRRRGQTGCDSYRSPLYPVLPLAGLVILATFLTADLVDQVARYSIATLGFIALVVVAWCRTKPAI